MTQQRNNLGARPSTFWVLLIGVVSGALYLLVYFTHQAIYFNGLSRSIADITIKGTLADEKYLLLSAATHYAGIIALFALYIWLIFLCDRGQLRERQAKPNQSLCEHFISLPSCRLA